MIIRLFTAHGTHREARSYAEWLLFGRGITAVVEPLSQELWR